MRKRKLKMRISYEIKRLAEIHLFSAYEKLIPPIKKQIKNEQQVKNNNDKSIHPLKVRGN